MNIKTKFNIGDTVYFMNLNKIISATIEDIKTKSTNGITEIRYAFTELLSSVTEDKVFESPEALINSLRLEFKVPDYYSAYMIMADYFSVDMLADDAKQEILEELEPTGVI